MLDFQNGKKNVKRNGKISSKIIFLALDSQSEIKGKFEENYVDTSYMPIGSVLFTRDALCIWITKSIPSARVKKSSFVGPFS